MEFDREIGLCTRAWSMASRRDEGGERCPQWFMRWIWGDLSSLNINISFLSESKLFWRLGGQLIGLKKTETHGSSLFSSRTGLERTQLRRRLFAFALQHLIFKAMHGSDPPDSLVGQGRQVIQMLQSDLWSCRPGSVVCRRCRSGIFLYILEFLPLEECYEDAVTEHCWWVPAYPCRQWWVRASEEQSGYI